ncbi:MAG: GNAT family N-acetyltransferase [Candidatus Eisenbacteria bacterium]
MSSSPEIRKMRAEEWEAYRVLRLRALAEDPQAFGSTFERENAMTDQFWRTRLASGTESADSHPVVATLDGAWVGLAWGRMDPDDPSVAHLYQMWVAPEARGRGVARGLLDSVIEWAHSRRATKLLLEVTCGDTPARRLYERAGFVPDGDPIPLRPGEDALEQPMVLSLDG